MFPNVCVHTQGFESYENYVPKEIYFASVDNVSSIDGFLISLTYFSFSITDDLINLRFSRTRHGLFYDKNDWSELQYERVHEKAHEMFQAMGGKILGVKDETQRDYFKDLGDVSNTILKTVFFFL